MTLIHWDTVNGIISIGIHVNSLGKGNKALIMMIDHDQPRELGTDITLSVGICCTYLKWKNMENYGNLEMRRVGIEPTSQNWKSCILPLK